MISWRSYLFLTFFVLQYNPTQAQTGSNGGPDVLFVLDGSSRVSPNQWRMVKDWLQRLVAQWHIGHNDLQVGFYTYGSGAYAQWKLNQAGTSAQLLQEIQGLQESGGTPDAGQAIRMAYREGFLPANGARAGRSKVIVHVTSGASTDPTYLSQEIQTAKQQGVSVYHVGIGPSGSSAVVNVDSTPGTEGEVASRYTFTTDNYETLDSLTATLAPRIAGEIPARSESTLPSTSGCLQKADVVLALDGSSSVGRSDFDRLAGFMRDWCSRLPVSPDGVHVGLVQFASRPALVSGLSLHTDRPSLLRAVDGMRYTGGGTNTALALQALRTQAFSQTAGARPGVPRVAVLVTDGSSPSMADAVKQADLLRRDNVEVIAVGVGSAVNTAELQGIADNSQDVIHVNDYSQMPQALESVLQRACLVQSTQPPLTATLDPAIDDPCKDNLANCAQYEADMCTKYAGWARDNCARHCRFCQPLLPDILPPCQDSLTTCGSYDKSMCRDPQYSLWAADNCALFCGMCGENTTPNGYYGKCYYKGGSYSTGETWDDGCGLQCTCENGETGRYKCYNRCPVYKDLPPTCTLVESPEDPCCLKPVCNFHPTIQTSVTSGLGRTPDGMKVCEYLGHQYVQGESWDVGCSLKCQCQEAATGKIKCQDYCPTYSVLPSNCKLHERPGRCCSEPVCEFQTQVGSVTGFGQTSGNGAVSRPTAPPPCMDKLDDCARYTASACAGSYRPWALENCRAFCGLCSNGTLVPTNNDTCMYKGEGYRQGETWDIECQQQCVCEEAVYGYYRCSSKCPDYSNLPSSCTRTPPAEGQCCETISCPATVTLSPSSRNVSTPGSGREIMQPDPNNPGHLSPLVPTPPPGGTVAPHPQNLQTISGCLYKGQLYVEGQRWDEGCRQVCECTSGDEGLYTCTARCPEYQNVPMGCTMQPDPSDPCCAVPVCQPQVPYVPVPVYAKGTVSKGEVRPPSPSELLHPTSQTVMVTQKFPQSANSPPTMPSGVVPTGGIGFCSYKGQTYGQSEVWTDGCDYNCLCEDASTGYWVCSDMCLHYPPMPQYCRLVTDTEFPCCQKPFCEIPGIKNSTFGMGTTRLPVITTIPPMVITSTTPPRPAMCVYKTEEYAQGQEWYDGCDFRCTCYDASANLYSCTERCPTFYGLDEDRCRERPDPRDPACCTVPVCRPPPTPATLTGPTPVPTAPGGSFEVTNTPGIGYCDYKGNRYHQGDEWTDGCQYSCQCLDDFNGRYRCDERCPRFPDLPAACRLVTDFANPCCQKPSCDFVGHGNTISGHANLQTPAPLVTNAPGTATPTCDYKGVHYNQGQTWDDGCNLRCRCEDAVKGLYVCDDRCASYGQLPAQCHLVADPSDQCCRVPQCAFTPTSNATNGHGAAPTPFPSLRPGHISGQVNVPTPAPGLTPPPLGYCMYQGRRYGQYERWRDGCQSDCVCQDASVGKYVCDEKCARFPHLPAQCRLVKDPANPCCHTPDCSFTPTAGTSNGQGTTMAPPPGSTLAPPTGPDGSTLMPPRVAATAPVPTPSPDPVCVYRGQAYTEGQTWYDGCDYICVCEKGSHGTYRCNDRCPSYPTPGDGVTCSTRPDPQDPMCCVIPECQGPAPTPLSPGGPYVVPTVAPQGVVTGGSVTPTPQPRVNPTPGPDGSTLAPPMTWPQEPVCVYQAQEYSQGEQWQDGCDYNCQCVDARGGQYRCTEMCPHYPDLRPGCYLVRDVYNPCCQTPVCPSPPTPPPTPAHPPTGVPPPTAPDGHTLRPPVANTPSPTPQCLYNGVPYHTGDTWEDGCDLRCRCEEETSNLYRCDQRCPRYEPAPGCTMVTDPRDTCCTAPVCRPTVPPTASPSLHPDPGATPAPVPTAIPGKIVGHTVNRPNTNNPSNQTMCVYDGQVYRQGDTWLDGCDYTCVCTDQATGRYECSERCPPYFDLPANCVLSVDPKDACCKTPVCASPVSPTPTPQPGTTGVPLPGVHTTMAPDASPTPSPVLQPKDVCSYKNAVYVQGQQWYDGCDKACVCEDATTGYYRCTDRCKAYPGLPAACRLVVDPRDPACCKVPQCAPTPGPLGRPSPAPGISPTPFTVTNVPGVVTGHAPTPTPGTDGQTPQPRNACEYKGRLYARGQRWQDGCDYNCVCDNDVTGEYTCTERCNTYPLVPPQCRLERDVSDFCCQVMRCDPSMSTSNPYLTPAPITTRPTVAPGRSSASPPTPGGVQTPRPVPSNPDTPLPGVTATPNPLGTSPAPVPHAFCVYNGVAYRQADTWQEGCSNTCRCDDADNNYYTCQDRCPTFNNLDPKCTLTLDPNDPCCQRPVCPDTPTVSPLSPGPNATPGTGGTPAPTPTPFAVPLKVPTGSITGGNPSPNPDNPQDMCLYKGMPYRQGQIWQDGCDFNCTCIDAKSGRYVCYQICPDYTQLTSLCTLVKDPDNPCCMKPLCSTPGTHSPPLPGTAPPPGSVTQAPPLGQSTVSPPVNPLTTRQPYVPPKVCVMKGRSYTQGQQWYDGCSQVCVCQDAATGFYTCRQRCPDYPDSDPTCLVVPDPSDPSCCTMPQCPDPTDPQTVTGHKGTITGTGHPPPVGAQVTPLPGHTLAPGVHTAVTPQPEDACFYKGQEYSTGQRWRDGCDYNCVCVDGTTGQYKCTDRCNKYPSLTTPGCRMVRDPSDPCCQMPFCSPTAVPPLYPTGPIPTTLPPSLEVCVYQGVPYRQGQTWTDGCDKVCRCEDAVTGRVNCDDRCPKYPDMRAGCLMVTDPDDGCCQMPQCYNPDSHVPTQVVTGVPGVIEGHSVPPQTGSPMNGGQSGCVYRGSVYQQGQQWDDGCSYSCVCEDASTGKYKCTQRCPRVASVPPTCSKVQDPSDLCCQLVNCPVTSTPTPFPPTPYHGPPTQSPPTTLMPPTPAGGSTQVPNPYNTPQPTPRAGTCLYKNQYYREKQVWYDGCDAVCTCEDGATGFYRCQERCGAYPSVSPSCVMVPDPKDPACCQMPECPLIPPGGTTPAGPAILRPPVPTAVVTNYVTPSPQDHVTAAPPTGPDGNTLAPPPLGGATKVPVPRAGCLYNGKMYHENEQWQDGCDFNCVCLSDTTGQYRCTERCARVPSVPQGCVLIQDPTDSCCQVPFCDFGPSPFPNGVQTPTPDTQQVPGRMTTPMYVVPGFVTINGTGATSTPTPAPTIGGSTEVCVYQGVIYRQGQTWNQGCDKSCVCDDAHNGLYTCTDRCPSYGDLDPACRLRVNPSDPCCLVPDCNPNYVTPVPGTGFTGTNVNVGPGINPGFTGIGVTSGPGTGFTGSNPHIHAGTGPSISGTRAPIVVPTAGPATFTGQRPALNPNNPNVITGYMSSCVYKGAVHRQGEKWQDGCQYRCQCIDAHRGTYRCTERCSSMYFLPASCRVEPDPSDSCCQRARCSPDAFPTPTPSPSPLPGHPHTAAPPVPTSTTSGGTHVLTSKPGPVFQGTRSPIGATVAPFTGKPRDQCVYTDGRTFHQGDTWTDGCAYTCMCNDAATNTYKCDFRCPAYSDLPSYCSLVDDPQDHCCQKVSCQPVQGHPLVPLPGDNKPTVSPTLPPNVTNVIPIGTHSVISGSGLVPGENTPGFFGGRHACMYKGTVHQAGESWDDGCDYTCRCLKDQPGVYQCASKCPKLPPLPQYCSLVSVPGLCCPSLNCNVPGAGTYRPTPELLPTPVSSTAVPQANPQMIVPGTLGPLTGGSNPAGHGTVIPFSSIGGVTDRCVYQGTDGQYRVYSQGETWVVNTCDYNCRCVDSRTGYYQCKPMCSSFTQGQLPASCRQESVQGECCPAVRCTNPDGRVVDYAKNPGQTYVPVYGLQGTGYTGFRPGYIPGGTQGFTGYKNVCTYKGVVYLQGSTWDDGCDYTCRCTDATTGLYTCNTKCQEFTALPPLCKKVTTTDKCCPSVQCLPPPTTAPLSTPTPNTPPTGHPASLLPCADHDKLDNCHMYDRATACSGVYEQWARDNCPVYCGYCTDSAPTTPGPCEDVLTNCEAYGPNACSGLYEAWARDNCRKTCNLCPCVDKAGNCAQYGSYACVGKYEAWARENCMHTCGYCSGQSATTTQPPSLTCNVPAGQTLLLKGVAGAPGDLYHLWSSPNSANAHVPDVQTLDSRLASNYKAPLANRLDTCDFDKIKVAIYSQCQEKASITFFSQGAGSEDWFSPSRIVDSTFTDLRGQSPQHFQLTGDPATGREVYVGGASSGCSGSAWMFVSTRSTCPYESGHKPGFFYATGNSAKTLQAGNFESGDVLAIIGEGGSCSSGVTTPHTNTGRTEVCVYQQNVYQQGEWWQDGCRYNCTCVDGSHGSYRCYDLCPNYTNLPANCSLVKNPGDCCTKPSCMMPGQTQGCVYKSNVYQQGQSWNDGCDYKCQCKDGSTGRYQCTSRCLQFNLPADCHMDPAPAGKCCQIPVCPPWINIQYPPGYVPE